MITVIASGYLFTSGKNFVANFLTLPSSLVPFYVEIITVKFELNRTKGQGALGPFEIGKTIQLKQNQLCLFILQNIDYMQKSLIQKL